MSYTQEEIVNHLKTYGFVFPSSEIYNGLANAWDYGPLGTLLKQNLKALWWNYFVTSSENIVGLDSSIILNKKVWETSGHLKAFSDPLIDCKHCHNRFRADQLILDHDSKIQISQNTNHEDLLKIIKEKKIACPICKQFDWTDIRNFNLMFQTNQGVIINPTNTIYLRPETAQGIFINFLNVQRSMRLKLPFGIAQIGKAFRNEITPGNFIFRTREFEQMEIEYFVFPNDSESSFQHLIDHVKNFLTQALCFQDTFLKIVKHAQKDLAHYATTAVDFEFKFPHGWSELCGIANRTDYDLKAHISATNANLWYLDPVSKQKIIPYVIEPSFGLERLLYAIICNTYQVQKLPNNETRIWLNLPYHLAPYKIAILPLTNKLNDQAQKIYHDLLKKHISCCYDTSGSIGKRYRRQDAIGTYYCLTFDFDSLNDHCVTIRDRNSMDQKRIAINSLVDFLNKNEQ